MNGIITESCNSVVGFCLTAHLSVEDLESLLHESLLLTFNTEIEDGSIEEVWLLFLSCAKCV